MTDKFWCQRRIENGEMPGPNGEPPRLFPIQDNWRTGENKHGKLTCSYCGSIHPDELFEAIDAGVEIGPTDKTYKIYLEGSYRKFYFQHFSQGEKQRFIDLLNEKKIILGYPGYFYVKPYFIAYGKAE